MDIRKGFVHVYTGDGKGKTTAAIGLAIRALGAGFKVLFAQFIKDRICSEHIALLKCFPALEFRQYGCGFIYGSQPSPNDITKARQGINEIREFVYKGTYDLIILDEANLAVHYNLFSVNDLLEIIDKKYESTEIVITGRYAHQKIIERADLVTDMICVKHYFEKGIRSRKGIEE
ncbi:MAG: cob(I)yrinic acid a,c-diamide adenosyltransferase [Thermodesulfovibrionales bacterium]|nr:cob(I)yrinic acid a,c-diamide adenosyltransferase [Thermodesulfovibrionales bacterium]